MPNSDRGRVSMQAQQTPCPQPPRALFFLRLRQITPCGSRDWETDPQRPQARLGGNQAGTRSLDGAASAASRFGASSAAAGAADADAGAGGAAAGGGADVGAAAACGS
eukprot:CAMPEP_0177274986 /NCGR_PEP_ID=MMETSP0367-20130122/67470_1 /TAXON_ID=447022 ORGANISM="Scrippsiella hangoei-like, Strain SHHI-4" /NCGR_SAMPLE_ID=MMETSP0367 /ASSEMBLY_ACC=CAM_ASM_000362 /LENGTH=107 /DNA_ID=CAMNT_0018731379 /DNA_START=748 /DNA_END=1067 /DNA_ORIENTATION=+